MPSKLRTPLRAYRAFWYLVLSHSLAAALSAATINLGFLSFDTTGSQSTNAITIQNLTGAESLSPDFPVLTPITFQNLSLTIVSNSNSSVVNLNNLGPGLYPNSAFLEFAATVEIESITLSATLDTSLFNVDGIGPQQANSPTLLVLLSPSVGDILQPGIDLALLAVETSDPPANPEIPEPSTWLTVLSALALFRIRR